ncbi:Crp/Fnr family transcriptional regulator [Pareuzebyella sediminis]|uniref:Crp/Fnr family transcriptional regulator n=1 Tax=Pareuzebyella sediminis TaxID=2607998 RepID=UPI0011EE06D4|nr:Crp/Fnr family transcriptional regulator [Pareuzebyella sediminis]
MQTENSQYLRSIETLKDSTFFKATPKDALAELMEKLVYRKWDKGTYLSGAYEPLPFFYIVVTGKIKEYQVDEISEKERTNFILSTGDVFDVLNLLDDRPHKIHWETLEETEVLMIRKEEMLRWMDKYPQAQKHLYQYMASHVRMLEDMTADLSMRPTLVRLSKLLIQSFDMDRGCLRRIDNLPNSELAKLIGTTRAVLNRHIQELKGCGAISVQRKKINIENTDRLMMIVQNSHVPLAAHC